MSDSSQTELSEGELVVIQAALDHVVFSCCPSADRYEYDYTVSYLQPALKQKSNNAKPATQTNHLLAPKM